MLLLHDNACPRTVTHTVETLKKLNLRYWSIPCVVLNLPLWTHLFGLLKQALRGLQFTTDQEMDVMVHAWLVSEPKTFYSKGIKQIVW